MRIMRWSLALSACLYSSTALAAGFYLQESSVKGLGTAFAGSVSSLEDASTVYFNPAGMTKLSGPQLQLGTHLLLPTAEINDRGSTFDYNGPGAGGIGAVTGGDGGNPYGPTPVPNLHIALPANENKLWFGLSVTAPFGMKSEYDPNWFGRYDSTRTELTTINIQPSLAIRVNDWLSIGGGVDLQYANAELESAVSNITSEGTSSLEGDDISAGYNLGMMLTPWQHTTVGMHYRSAMQHTLNGRVAARGLDAGNFDIAGTADLNLPDIATIGLTQSVSPNWRLMSQFSWYGWSNFDTIRAKNSSGTTVSNIPQNYKDTLAWSIGTEWDSSARWTWRLGYQFDPTPTTDGFRTSRTPDGDRHWFTSGATYRVSDATTLDIAAAYIDVANEEITLTRNSGYAVINAESEGQVGIISAAINYRF